MLLQKNGKPIKSYVFESIKYEEYNFFIIIFLNV